MLVWLSVAMLAGAVLATLLSGSMDRARAQNAPGAEIRTNVLEVNIQAGSSVVWIYGSNLTPGTQVTILALDRNGVYTDISAMATPFPLIVNDDGAFAARWQVAQWSNAQVGAEGVFTLLVVDEDFNTLGTAPISMCRYAAEPRTGANLPANCSR